MAQGGQSGGSAPQNNGRRTIASLITLNTGQQQDARKRDRGVADILGGDTPLTDDSISSQGDALRPSVLESGASQKQLGSSTSGTEPEAPPTGGGTMESVAAQIQRMQYEDQRKRETMASFVGDVTPTPGSPSPSTSVPPAKEAQQTQTEEEEEETAEEAEQEQAARVARDQAESSRKQQAEQELKKQVEKQLQRTVKQGAQTSARLTIEGAEVGTSEALIPLIVLIVQLNLQMISKYFFKPLIQGTFGDEADNAIDGAPFLDQSFEEDIITLMIDTGLIAGVTCCNPACAPIVFVIIVGGVIIGKIKGILP